MQRSETQVFEKLIGDFKAILLLDDVFGKLIEEPETFIGGQGRGD